MFIILLIHLAAIGRIGQQVEQEQANQHHGEGDQGGHAPHQCRWLTQRDAGRIGVASQSLGVMSAAFEEAVKYAHQRQAFGQPLAKIQAIQFKLAEMATKVEASHSLMVNAARLKDMGKRNDVEAGMAKLLASEYCAEITQESFRIHGGYGYSKEYEIERLMRDAPFLLIGEGTSEIQRLVIARALAKRGLDGM